MIRDGIRRAFRLALRRRDRWEREVEDEITLHLTLRAEQLVAGGTPRSDAFHEAARRFGPLTESRRRLLDAARHREQRMHRTEYIADLRQDIAFGLRSLGRQKGWTAVAALTLALGIGATTAVFSVVSALLLHAVSYPHGSRVVDVFQQPSEGNATGIGVTIWTTAPVARAWQHDAHSFEALEGTWLDARLLKTTDEPVTLRIASVSPTFMQFAGEHPLIGRTFTQQDIADGGHVLLLGESLWRGRFGADSQIVGKTISLDDSVYAVIGVAPATLGFPSQSLRPVDAWIPLDIGNDKANVDLIGRLRPGATIPGAMRELDSLYARQAGFAKGKIPFKTVIVTPAQRVDVHDALIMLAWAVALVLLVACANVAHLVLARSVTRQHELAVRAALGAGRGRVLRQLLTESLILSLGGAVAGIALGWATLRGLIALRPDSLDSLPAAHLDLETLGVAIAIAVFTGAVFAAIGAIQSARLATHDVLKSGSARTSRSRGSGRVRSLLVVSEMALSGTLLVGAALLLRSVINLQTTDLGFTSRGLYSLSLPLARNHLLTPAARAAFLRELLARVEQVPGVRSATIASVPPGARWFSIGQLEVDRTAAIPTTKTEYIDVNGIQNGYFKTLGIPLQQGSGFTDTSATSHEVIINATFARARWPGASAVGHRVRIAQSDSQPWLTIVGVAGDAATSGPTAQSSAPILYTPYRDVRTPVVLIRVGGGLSPLASVLALAKHQGLTRSVEIESVEDVVSKSIAAPRFVTVLLSIFTALAVALAGVGLYGVMAYTVTQRTREIGIRVALGASPGRIAQAVIVQGTGLAVIGAIIGLVAAVWGTKLIESQLRGVTRLDPASFVIGGVVLIMTAAVACVLPTRRALAVDPMTAIRMD